MASSQCPVPSAQCPVPNGEQGTQIMIGLSYKARRLVTITCGICALVLVLSSAGVAQSAPGCSIRISGDVSQASDCHFR